MNTPAQNFAFLCLLWSYIEINQIRREEQWKTTMLGQIHDSTLLDLSPDEQDHNLSVCRRVMCEDIKNEFPFIIVPLSVDVEITPVNCAWNTKERLRK